MDGRELYSIEDARFLLGGISPDHLSAPERRRARESSHRPPLLYPLEPLGVRIYIEDDLEQQSDWSGHLRLRISIGCNLQDRLGLPAVGF